MSTGAAESALLPSEEPPVFPPYIHKDAISINEFQRRRSAPCAAPLAEGGCRAPDHFVQVVVVFPPRQLYPPRSSLWPAAGHCPLSCLRSSAEHAKKKVRLPAENLQRNPAKLINRRFQLLRIYRVQEHVLSGHEFVKLPPPEAVAAFSDDARHVVSTFYRPVDARSFLPDVSRQISSEMLRFRSSSLNLSSVTSSMAMRTTSPEVSLSAAQSLDLLGHLIVLMGEE